MRTIWGRCLLWTLGTAAFVLALAGALHLLMDPLAVFGTPRVAGLNATKPYLSHDQVLTRWKLAERACAPVGFFGNSRVEIGFDPQSDVLQERGLTAFNHAIPGTPIDTSVHQLRWLQAIGCSPRIIVLGVEFFDFLGGTPATQTSARAVADPPRADARFFSEAVFSVVGLRDAATTLGVQYARYPATLTAQGFNPLLNYAGEVERTGHYALFRQRAVENWRNWARKPPRLVPIGGGPSSDDVGLSAFLSLAAASGAEVHVIIYPYHVQIRQLIERLGLDGLFNDWKLSLLTRTSDAGETVRLWDFSTPAGPTVEAIPGPGDRRTRLTYYWEAGHFKKELGDLMLARVLGAQPGFGAMLTADTLQGWLAQDQARLTVARNPALLAEIDKLPPVGPDREP